jgi:methionyl-tRNA synthetase
MSSPGKFYLTTPIFYVNDKPHIGHAYTTMICDTLARYWRMRGVETFFLTGTDENSQKNVEAAEGVGEKDTQKYVDRMSALWRSTFDSLAITNNDFIRTTEERHKKGVEKFWKAVEAKGDIYQGTYEGWYCDGCESFIADNEVADDRCPIHKKPLKRLKEKNYFFKLSNYREALLKHIEEHPEFVQPESRRNEVVSYIKNFMEDLSISRETMKWGIPVPGDSEQVIYVWFDALLNYITAMGYGTDEKNFEQWWPAELQVVGKDILKFHCAIWPAMLMAAGVPLPKGVFAHGFFTINGEKMSKSLGNFIDPLDIVKQYDLDTLRYYFLRDLPFGEDGDFSTERLAARYETELANDLGNLVHRVLSMTEQYLSGKVPQQAVGEVKVWHAYDEAMEELRPHDAVAAVWAVVRDANKLVGAEKPWELAKNDTERLGQVLYKLLETLRHIAWMLIPILPETSNRIFVALGISDQTNELSYADAKTWGKLPEGAIITKGDPLFPKKELGIRN